MTRSLATIEPIAAAAIARYLVDPAIDDDAGRDVASAVAGVAGVLLSTAF
jgi:hypothetical protein